MKGLDYRLEDGVAHITLTAARVGWRLIGDLTPLPTRAAAEGARAILLTASGDDFSHGVDLVDPELAGRLRSDGGRSVAEAGQRLVDNWAESPIPIVVALQGRAIGAGACLAVAADFRFATPDATIAFPEVARVMHLSWGIVPRIVTAFGLQWARWLAVGGETIELSALGGAAARVVAAPQEDARRWALHLASLPPLAVRHIRAVLTDAVADARGAASADPERFVLTAQSADFAEAMAAWFEKRPGVFKGE